MGASHLPTWYQGARRLPNYMLPVRPPFESPAAAPQCACLPASRRRVGPPCTSLGCGRGLRCVRVLQREGACCCVQCVVNHACGLHAPQKALELAHQKCTRLPTSNAWRLAASQWRRATTAVAGVSCWWHTLYVLPILILAFSLRAVGRRLLRGCLCGCCTWQHTTRNAGACL